jgi:hypothetical protein
VYDAIARLLSRADSPIVAFDVFSDGAGSNGIAVACGDESVFVACTRDECATTIVNLIATSGVLACFDMRKVLDIGLQLPCTMTIVDVKLLYDYPSNVVALAQKELADETSLRLSNAATKVAANIKACKTAGVDLARYSALAVMPRQFVEALYRSSAESILELTKRKWSEIESYSQRMYSFARALYTIERTGAIVDLEFMRTAIGDSSYEQHEKKFLASIAQSQIGGAVYATFNPCGGKTGRIKVDRGFNFMGIPRGRVRKAIVSRHSGGSIFVLDFNAIDFRSIVWASEDVELIRLYSGARDFHEITMHMLRRAGLDVTRDDAKSLIYTYLYGGSDATVAEKTGKSLIEAVRLMAAADSFLRPAADLRDALVAKAWADGHVTTSDGRKIPVTRDDHAGKVLGLFAQGNSSYAFEMALVAAVDDLAKTDSRVIFTVHDEIVIDAHPSDDDAVMRVVAAMERAAGQKDMYRVNVMKGKSYGDAEKIDR